MTVVSGPAISSHLVRTRPRSGLDRDGRASAKSARRARVGPAAVSGCVMAASMAPGRALAGRDGSRPGRRCDPGVPDGPAHEARLAVAHAEAEPGAGDLVSRPEPAR